jgi:hypothetical protein
LVGDRRKEGDAGLRQHRGHRLADRFAPGDVDAVDLTAVRIAGLGQQRLRLRRVARQAPVETRPASRDQRRRKPQSEPTAAQPSADQVDVDRVITAVHAQILERIG